MKCNWKYLHFWKKIFWETVFPGQHFVLSKALKVNIQPHALRKRKHRQFQSIYSLKVWLLHILLPKIFFFYLFSVTMLAYLDNIKKKTRILKISTTAKSSRFFWVLRIVYYSNELSWREFIAINLEENLDECVSFF